MKAVLAEMERRKRLNKSANKPRRRVSNEYAGRESVVMVYGEKYTFRQLEAKYGVKIGTLKNRYINGLRDDELVSIPSKKTTYLVGGKKMTIPEIADWACVSTRTVARWIKDGVDIYDLVMRDFGISKGAKSEQA